MTVYQPSVTNGLQSQALPCVGRYVSAAVSLDVQLCDIVSEQTAQMAGCIFGYFVILVKLALKQQLNEQSLKESLPRVTSRNGILTFTITDLHLLDAQCHTCCMAQCNDLLQPMSITSAASQTAAAPAASIAVTTATVTRAAVTTSAIASGA